MHLIGQGSGTSFVRPMKGRSKYKEIPDHFLPSVKHRFNKPIMNKDRKDRLKQIANEKRERVSANRKF